MDVDPLDHIEQSVMIPVGRAKLAGDLVVPEGAAGIVLFAHGSGSSRKSSRNRYVSRFLQRAGLATLLMDLLTQEEEVVDDYTREFRFDIPRLGARLVAAVDWLQRQDATRNLAIGTFGASTGAAAAIIAAAERPDTVKAVVSRGGRPDLAGVALPRVQAPALLIVGGWDEPVIELNRQAMQCMTAPTELVIVPEATHLFEEPGKLEQVAGLAANWFTRHLGTTV